MTFADIRVGDTVRTGLGERSLRVLEADCTANLGSYVHLKLSPGPGIAYWGAQPSRTPIILVCRPWPEGTNDIHARSVLTDKLANIVGRATAIRKPMSPQEIREAQEALEVYELGKPEVES